MKQLPEGQTLLSQRQTLLSQKRKGSQSDVAGALGHHMSLAMPKLSPPKPPISGLFPFGQVPNSSNVGSGSEIWDASAAAWH